MQPSKVGDSTLQLSLSFDNKKNGETSFQLDPSPTGTPSEVSMSSWSEGAGDPLDSDEPVGRRWLSETKRRFRKTCTTKLLKRRLPIIEWLPKYTVESAFSDCIAGFTVALTAIPQGIAYGAVAGVPVEVGAKSFKNKINTITGFHVKKKFLT